MLGSGLIGELYTEALHSGRTQDRVAVAYSRHEDRAHRFAASHGIERWTTDMAQAVRDPEVDVIVVALPNSLHETAVGLAAEAGKAVLCTKPLGRTAAEARRMVEVVEDAGVFAGYLEDLCFAPKIVAAAGAVRSGAVGEIVSVRSREAHGGPHSAWFSDPHQAGGGVLLDMGSHSVEIIRTIVGKQDRPVDVMCTISKRQHGDVEDDAFALVRFASGAVGQIEVSWTARGGMDLRDEINGTRGTIRLDHFRVTGFEMYTSAASGAPHSEKAEAGSGWHFPVADSTTATGNAGMFTEMLDAMDQGKPAPESFYDGYVVNEIIDACYRSASSGTWEAVEFAHQVREAAP